MLCPVCLFHNLQPNWPVITKCFSCCAGYSSREFGDQGTQHVAQLLRPRPNPDGSWAYNGVLKSLSLQWNNIGPAGAQALARSLQPHVAADGRRAFNASLKDLNLRRNRIGDAGLEALAAVMALRPDPATGRWLYCSGLTSLDVSCCSIGGPGVSALAEALSPQLDGDGSWAWPPVQSLNLYGNSDIGSEALEALCGALLAPRQDAAGSWVYNPHLASLSVDGGSLYPSVQGMRLRIEFQVIHTGLTPH